jgi:hypothetical protein
MHMHVKVLRIHHTALEGATRFAVADATAPPSAPASVVCRIVGDYEFHLQWAPWKQCASRATTGLAAVTQLQPVEHHIIEVARGPSFEDGALLAYFGVIGAHSVRMALQFPEAPGEDGRSQPPIVSLTDMGETGEVPMASLGNTLASSGSFLGAQPRRFDSAVAYYAEKVLAATCDAAAAETVAKISKRSSGLNMIATSAEMECAVASLPNELWFRVTACNACGASVPAVANSGRGLSSMRRPDAVPFLLVDAVAALQVKVVWELEPHTRYPATHVMVSPSQSAGWAARALCDAEVRVGRATPPPHSWAWRGCAGLPEYDPSFRGLSLAAPVEFRRRL